MIVKIPRREEPIYVFVETIKRKRKGVSRGGARTRKEKMEGATPIQTMSRRRSSIATPIMDSLENPAPRSGRRPTDEIHKQLSPEVTPDASTRRLSMRSDQRAAEKPDMGKEELDHLMKNCNEMARSNKFTNENVWSLPFIEHLPEMMRSDDLSSRGFERMSAGLITAVQIYGKKVDSTLTQALEALHRVSKRSRRQDEEGGSIDAGLDEEEEPVLTSQTTRRRQKRNVQTLSKGEEVLEDNRDLPGMDGVFDKMRARLDQGGCHGMMGQLGMCGLQWRSNPKRSKEGPMSLDTSEYELKLDFRDLWDVAPFDSTQSNAAEGLRDILDLSQPPSQTQQEDLRNYMEEAEDCLRRQEASQSFVEEPYETQNVVNSPQQAPVEMDECFDDGDANGDIGGALGEDDLDENEGINDFNLPGEANIDVNFFEMENGATDIEGQVPAGDMEGLAEEGPSSRMEGDGTGEQDGGFALPPGSDNDGDFGPLPQDLQNLLTASSEKELHGKSRWSHWKYHQSTIKPKRPKKPKRRNPEVDWEDLEPSVRGNALQVAADASKINLKSRKHAQSLRPESFHYKASFIAEEFFHSRVGITKNERKTNQLNRGDDGQQPMDDDWGFDDDGGGGDGDFNLDNLNDENGGNQLEAGAAEYDKDGFLKEPEKIQHITVDAPKYSQQVNVKALKMDLHQILKKLSQNMPSGFIHFSEVVSQLAEIRGQGAVSVHMCFIALLHLANEHCLHIKNTHDLREMHIKVPNHFC